MEIQIDTTKTSILEYLTSQKTNFEQEYYINKIGLFGSFARDEQSENSDIDLIYVLDTEKKITYFKLFELQQILEEYFKRKVELINYKYINPIIKYKSLNDIIYV